MKQAKVLIQSTWCKWFMISSQFLIDIVFLFLFLMIIVFELIRIYKELETESRSEFFQEIINHVPWLYHIAKLACSLAWMSHTYSSFCVQPLGTEGMGNRKGE